MEETGFTCFSGTTDDNQLLQRRASESAVSRYSTRIFPKVFTIFRLSLSPSFAVFRQRVVRFECVRMAQFHDAQ